MLGFITLYQIFVSMIRKRLRRVEEIDSELDSQLQGLHIADQESTHRLEEQIHQFISKKDEQDQLQIRLQEQFKAQIIGSLNNLHLRINKLQSQVKREKGGAKNNRHQRRLSYQKGGVPNKKDKEQERSRNIVTKHPSLAMLEKGRKSLKIHPGESHIKTFSMTTPKNCERTKRNSFSSVKVLEGMIQEEMTNLKENKERERLKFEQSRTDKKSIQEKIRKIEGVLENEKNMECLYRNLEWQTKELVETLNETRNLCSYQKQKLQMYKSKLRHSKRCLGKENL